MVESYPGQHTEFFYVAGNVPTGPVVGLVELFRHKINPDTPVWYDGLADWTPALMADLTRQLFTPDSPFYRAHPEALAIMNGRLAGADPDTLPTLVDDSANETDEVPALPETIATDQPAAVNEQSDPEPPALPQTPSPTEPIAVPDLPKPPSYLALAIIATILCCIPAGIVAIVYAARVNGYYSHGDIANARRASERAQLWIILSIVLGLIASVAWLFWGQAV